MPQDQPRPLAADTDGPARCETYSAAHNNLEWNSCGTLILDSEMDHTVECAHRGRLTHGRCCDDVQCFNSERREADFPAKRITSRPGTLPPS